MSEPVVAEYAIRQLHARYIDATWRQDIAAFTSCFSEDADWKIAGRHVFGREAIGDTLTALLTGSRRVLMTISNLLLDIETETAAGRVLVTEFVKRTNGDAMRTIGSYRDRYICKGDIWQFQSRHWHLRYRGPMDLSAPIDI